MPTIVINGRECAAAEGASVLDVARAHDIFIPSLCYHPAVAAYGACRLCLVEVEQRGRRRLVTSCTYPAREGIQVFTDTDRAVRVRRGMMQLLRSRAKGSGRLKEYARLMGVTGKTVYPKVTEAQRDCILCGLCVAVCEQVIGASAIAFADRGVNRAVAAPFREASETCVGCGACAAVCPVGTIKLRWHADAVEVSPFKSRVPLRRCAECGVEIGGETFAAQVQAKAGAVAEGMRLCARCKRQAVARHLLKVAQRPDGGGD